MIGHIRVRNLEERDRRLMRRDLGISVEGYALPVPDISSVVNALNGAVKRNLKVFDAQHTVRRSDCVKLQAFTDHILRDNFEPIPMGEDMSVSRWLQECKNYNLARKQELLDVDSCWDNMPLSKNERSVNSFIKDENYTDWKYPRIINSCSDRVKVRYGPAAKLMEVEVYSNNNHLVVKFIKHVPMKDRIDFMEDLISVVGGTYIATDYSSFECSFSSEIMQCVEQRLYAHMLTNYPEIAREFSLMTGWNRCSFRNGVRMRIKGRRMSGEMTTSLGNGFTNMILMLYMAHEQKKQIIGAVVEGDDGILSVYGDLDIEETARLGFDVKKDVCVSLARAGFCGMKYDEDDRVMMVDPLEAILKVGWSGAAQMHARPEKVLGLLRAKMLSLAYECPGCPILTELADYGIRVTQHVKPIWEEDYWTEQIMTEVVNRNVLADHIYTTRARRTMRTRQAFEELYGISIAEQLRCEEYLNSLSTVTHLAGPILRLFESSDRSCIASWKSYYDNYVVDYNCGDSW